MEVSSIELQTTLHDKYRRAESYADNKECEKADELLDYCLIQLSHYTEQAALEQVKKGRSFYDAEIDKVFVEGVTLKSWKTRVWTLIEKIGTLPV